ncbi:hypothetical protein [Thalassomonas actiniarum]|uniref:Uncharacterized protein n=1 Tax=Thalassomonas actiniarum TaxID=485447 RepID=A0AAE9YV91_9GAMM|nr:hypothetical protein [Thalassomonas actiniarum]WDE01458.1 hypothetical protein SG35_013070 [Thalassomonas actiniarum]
MCYLEITQGTQDGQIADEQVNSGDPGRILLQKRRLRKYFSPGPYMPGMNNFIIGIEITPITGMISPPKRIVDNLSV